MLKIETVVPYSYAADLGLSDGDYIISINGHAISDILDYHLHINQDHLDLEVMHEDEIWELVLDKDAEEDFGVAVEHPQPQQCGNQCLFCFVHQLPKGLRKTLYIKDEDYRFSYLYGSYITLTNLSEAEVARIIDLQLSPLYISVHASNAALREQLLGVEVPDVMPLIRRLTAAGIVLHCQVVLCPGLNDAEALENTICDLAELYPGVASLAVVPVGLTKYRDKLPHLNRVTPAVATECLSLIEACQQRFLSRHGTRFVFPADEFYLKAGREIPPFADYEDCSQLENGVGMIAQFRQQAEEVLLDAEPLGLKKVSLVCGSSFGPELQAFAARMASRTDVELQVFVITNNFFGSEVTVSGLITGTDLLDQLERYDLGDGVLIPDVMLKNGEDMFLDDLSVDLIKSRLNTSVLVVDSSPWGVLEGLELLADGPEVIHCRE